MSQENVEVVRRCFDLLNREGVEGVLAAIDDVCDPEMEMGYVGRLPDVGGVHGREAVKTWFAEVLGTLDMRFEVDEFIDAGDSVIAVFRQIARGRASGAGLTDRFVFVLGVRDGKVTSMDGYRTKDEALEAVGLSE
jgi:ketosteroid isomerase-like protein